MADLRSMTGFGRGEASSRGIKVLSEIRSVNHRYLELSLRMPRAFGAFETEVRDLIKERLSRGKVDVFISFQDEEGFAGSLILDETLAGEYALVIKKISERFNVPCELSAYRLARFPDVISSREKVYEDPEILSLIKEAAGAALDRLIAQRKREGDNLLADILSKLSELEECVARIEEISPDIVRAYRQRLTNKINEILSEQSIDMDDVRIVSEAAIYADRICTDEETVRLRSHISQMKSKLIGGGSIGRELDFILQEMMRETNTTLSKSNDLLKSDTAVSMKTLIEKIREQVQNIE